jgi:hypothetical protein
MKKLIIMLIAFSLLIALAGCGGSKTGTTPSNPTSQEQVKVVHIDSDPEGATVFVDENYVVRTPADVKLTIGKHNIIFNEDGYQSYTLENAEVKKDTNEIKVVLKKLDDTSLIKLTKSNLGEALLNLPSKLIFVSNDTIYVSDENGKETEKIAVTNSNYDVRIYGISPDSKWVILNLSPRDYTSQFLYALNIETLKLMKVAQDDWEGGYDISFEMGDDKLLYGFQGVNAPIGRLTSLDLNTRKVSYLLDCSKNNEERAYDYDISADKKYIAYAGGNVEVFPDNRTGLYLKNLETGELKLLVKPSNLNQNLGEDYISSVEFVNGGKEILYVRTINTQNSTYNPTTEYYIVDFEGNSKEITPEEASKLTEDTRGTLETKVKKSLNKNLYINAVLDKCKKIVFTTLDDPERLYICDADFSDVVYTGILNPNFMNFSSNSCKFTCQVLSPTQASVSPTSIWYLIDAATNKKINLNKLFKVEVKDAIYIGE